MENLCDAQVEGGRDLDVAVVAGAEPGFEAGEFEELNVVGDALQRDGALGESALEVGASHHLGGLHGPQRVTRNGLGHASGKGPGGALDGERDRESGDGCSALTSEGEGAVDQIL